MMDPIQHTHHCPICDSIQPVIIPQPIPFRRCFNLMKADWTGYSTGLDNLIEDIKPILANDKCFVDSVRVASTYIPTGCRTEYVPGLTDESKSTYKAYKIQYLSNRSVNPRMNEEFHIRRRPVHHSPVPYLPRS